MLSLITAGTPVNPQRNVVIHDRCYLVYLLAVLGLAASCSLNVIYDKRWKQTLNMKV